MSRRRQGWDHLYRIDGPGLVAVLSIGIDGLVNWANPQLDDMVGWEYDRVIDRCRTRGWTLQNLTQPGLAPIGWR
jgi:hypothetical protein